MENHLVNICLFLNLHPENSIFLHNIDSFLRLNKETVLFSTVANDLIKIICQNKALKLIIYSSLPFSLQTMTSSLRLTYLLTNEHFILQDLVFLCNIDSAYLAVL